MARQSKKAKAEQATVPVEAVQELADKAAQVASIGGSGPEQIKNDQSGETVQVDIDYLRTTKIHCAVPCYSGMVTENTFMSFIKFSNAARQLGLDWSIETTTNESLVSRARNTMVANFLAQPEKTHLMFIDSDIGWEPWHLLVLANRQVDVISGLYSLKTLPVRWVVNVLENAEQGPDGLVEVGRAGSGFMLIKRDVFTKLDQHPEVKPYANDIGLDPAVDKHLRTYFDTSVRNNRYYSEDWTFCENWRQLGGKVWVDTRVLLTHKGSFNYSAVSQDQLTGVLGPVYVEYLKNNGQLKVEEPTVATEVAPAVAQSDSPDVY